MAPLAYGSALVTRIRRMVLRKIIAPGDQEEAESTAPASPASRLRPPPPAPPASRILTGVAARPYFVRVLILPGW